MNPAILFCCARGRGRQTGYRADLCTFVRTYVRTPVRWQVRRSALACVVALQRHANKICIQIAGVAILAQVRVTGERSRPQMCDDATWLPALLTRLYRICQKKKIRHFKGNFAQFLFLKEAEVRGYKEISFRRSEEGSVAVN